MPVNEKKFQLCSFVYCFAFVKPLLLFKLRVNQVKVPQMHLSYNSKLWVTKICFVGKLKAYPTRFSNLIGDTVKNVPCNGVLYESGAGDIFKSAKSVSASIVWAPYQYDLPTYYRFNGF